jgi:hypothetical protein
MLASGQSQGGGRGQPEVLKWLRWSELLAYLESPRARQLQSQWDLWGPRKSNVPSAPTAFSCGILSPGQPFL